MPGVAPLWPPDVGRGPLWCVVVVEVATAATTPVVAIATATATTTVTAPTAIEGVGVVGANVAFGGTIGCRWRRRKGASLLRCNTSYQKGSLGSALVVCLAGILLCENEFTGFNERGEFRKERQQGLWDIEFCAPTCKLPWRLGLSITTWIHVMGVLQTETLTYGKPYLDKRSKRYWPWNTDYSENPDCRTDLNLLNLWPSKWFFLWNFWIRKL
jgi:hypothetical protein